MSCQEWKLNAETESENLLTPEEDGMVLKDGNEEDVKLRPNWQNSINGDDMDNNGIGETKHK